MITDVHGAHLINYRYTPKKIYTDREWNLKHLSPLLWEALDHDMLVNGVEAIYNLFAEKDIDAQPVAKLWFASMEKYWNSMLEEYKTAGFKRVVSLSIDFFPWTKSPDVFNQWASQKYLQLTLAPKYGITIEPFMGIDPIHLSDPRVAEIFEQNIEDFSGVKLYPPIWDVSPGPKGWIDCPEVVKLFHICNEHKKPIIMHCNTGGIGEHKDNSEPAKFRGLLAKFPYIRLLFAHSGWGRKEWRDQIVELVEIFQSEDGLNRVFCDNSFHDNAFHSPDDYFNSFRDYLARGFMIGAMCLGTDWPLFKFYKYGIKDLYQAHIDHLDAFTTETISVWNPDTFLTGQ